MIQKLTCFLAICIAISSCNTAAKKQPVTDIEVATAFIRGALDNDFKTARQYLLKDETNQQFLETFERQHHSMSSAELDKYKSADIVINEIKPENDSVHFVNYSNTFKKEQKTNLKLVWVNGQWLVDLKYTFEKQ
jgi:type IV secretory pathway component VirB8